MEKAEKLRQLLREGEVRFTFLKADGSTRQARGTLKMEDIPLAAHPTGESKRQVSDSVQVFYDLDKNSWRSCRKDSIINIES